MAEQIAQDVVKEAKSMGDASPIDATATTSTLTSAGNGEAASVSNAGNAKQSVLPATSNSALNTADDLKVDGYSVDKLTQRGASPTTDRKAEVDQLGGSFAQSPLVNGDVGDSLSSEDGLAQPTLADASGGSDTDTSRDLSKEGSGGHLRTNSVKKPTSFKSVSVTKNFLAKTLASTPSGRIGDKASAAGQSNSTLAQSPKPRLVAKSGSGIGNSLPRSGLSKLNGNGTGPDASKVWNKNRPVPPPPPKQFTDEELKQQYGIHMATRLQSDENGKEAKWADIDDDEDDWAPEPVEWMDGTKSLLTTATENPPPQAEEEKPEQEQAMKEKSPERPLEAPAPAPAPASTPKLTPSSTGGTKTILKPGALANQPKPGISLKTGSEKPTLVSKSPAPIPQKNPWAPLPPVEKMSPVQINPPSQQLSARFAQRDPHGFDALQTAPSQAKEIAADDFNRAWRDDRTNKELFDSKSGRYEPVNDVRRGSFRDANVRQPAVLQRPSHPGQGGPAEPSAAFQTSRSTAGDSTWGRRRGSSNVSGGSGRRMSFGRPSDGGPLPAELQRGEPFAGSEVISPSETPRPGFQHQHPPHPERIASPNNTQQQGWTQHSPVLHNAQPTSPYGSVGSSGAGDAISGPPGTGQDPVAIQQQLMREKIERARLEKQRQREEEEREEAAKKERLRKKLEALGPAPEPKQEKPKERSPAHPDGPVKDKPIPTVTPPKPPIPTSEGDVVQYGMIKLHQPHPVKKLVHSPERPLLSEAKIPGKPTESATAENSISSKLSPSPAKALVNSQAPANSASDKTGSRGDVENHPRQNNYSSSSGVDRNQSWKPPVVSSEPYSGWSGPITGQTPSSNVWGPPPSQDKALGNGTFDVSSGRQHPRRTAQNSSQQASASAPGLIAPPASLKTPGPSQVSSGHASNFDHSRTYTGQSEARASQPTAAPRLIPQDAMTSLPISKPGPIGPPSKTQHVSSQERSGASYNMPEWNNLSSSNMRQPEVAKEETPAYRTVIRETFKQITPGPILGQRRIVRTEMTVHESAPEKGGANEQKALPSPRSHSTLEQHSGPSQPSQEENQTAVQAEESSRKEFGLHERSAQSASSHASAAGRSSRFFPRPSETSQQSTASASDSPPPPETQSHPAHAGDMSHPVVNLPRPKAKVRLPPVSPSPPKPVVMPVRPELPQVGAQPIVKQTAWQARFDGLFENRNRLPVQPKYAPVQSPPKPQAVTSHSKAPLDVSSQKNSATVSLPVRDDGGRSSFLFSSDSGKEPVTKATAEEDLLEDRVFASLPRVCVPKIPLSNTSYRSPVRTTRSQRNPRPVESQSTEMIGFPEEEAGESLGTASQNNFNVRICVPKRNASGPFRATIKLVPRKRKIQYTKKRNYTPRENSSTATSPRSKKPSNGFQGQPPQSNSRSSPTSNGWVNGRSSTQGNPWNKRAVSGVVH